MHAGNSSKKFKEANFCCPSTFVLVLEQHETRRKDFNMIPYKIQIIQTLGDHDNDRRTDFCPPFGDFIEGVPGFLKNTWLTNETHLYLNEVVDRESS
jgi:hypothetical protein